MRPTEKFGGHSDFVFLVEDLGEAVAREILGVSQGTFELWLSGDADAPQMACMALYPWSHWYRQAAYEDHHRELGNVWAMVQAHRWELRRAQQLIDQLSRPSVGGPSNEAYLVRFDRWAVEDVPRHTLEAERPSDLSDGRGLTT